MTGTPAPDGCPPKKAEHPNQRIGTRSQELMVATVRQRGMQPSSSSYQYFLWPDADNRGCLAGA